MSPRLAVHLRTNAVAYLALFVALGGSAYAAVTVTGANVKNGSLTGRDVRNNSLTGADVKRLGGGDVRDGTLRAKDFKPGELPAGAKGDTGEKGDTGAAGASAATATLAPAQTLRGSARYRQGQAAEPAATTAQALNQSFAIPTAADAKITVKLRESGVEPSVDCPGTAAAPEAAKGFLCVYKGAQTGNIAGPFTQVTNVTRWGFAIEVVSTSGAATANFSWAVTAP
ncbi:MAG: hypothetical protein ACJ762_14960 [Solirubrobacteraceae bacterium]